MEGESSEGVNLQGIWIKTLFPTLKKMSFFQFGFWHCFWNAVSASFSRCNFCLQLWARELSYSYIAGFVCEMPFLLIVWLLSCSSEMYFASRGFTKNWISIWNGQKEQVLSNGLSLRLVRLDAVHIYGDSKIIIDGIFGRSSLTSSGFRELNTCVSYWTSLPWFIFSEKITLESMDFPKRV